MSKRKRRLDTHTRIVTDPERRKRRNLSDYPAGHHASGAVVEPPSGCANLAPLDAGTERCTVQTTSEVAALAYPPVLIEATGLIPGADVISYCYEGKVGPNDGPIYTSCDGNLSLTEDGLVHSDLIDGQVPGGVDAFWDRWDKETGILGGYATLRYDAVNKNYWVAMWPSTKSKVGAVIISKVSQDFPRDNWAMQADFRRVIFQEGSGGLDVGVGVVLARSEALGIFDECYGFGHYAGFVGTPVGHTFRYTAGFWVDLKNQIQAGDGFTSWVQDDEQEGYFRIDGASTGTPFVTTDAVNKDTVGGCGLIVCKGWYSDGQFTNTYQEGQFQNIYICKSKPIEITDVPTGWYGRLLLNDGDDLLSAVAESGGSFVFPSRDSASVGATQYWRWPFQGFQIFDGAPFGGGVLQLECKPARGVFPGDVWTLGPVGGGKKGKPGYSQLDVSAAMELKIYDIDDVVIATYETLGVRSEGYTRSIRGPDFPQPIRQPGAGTRYLDIPIPFNASYMIFTPYKRGTADAFACVRNLQVNIGGEACCEYATPGVGVAVANFAAHGYSYVSTDDVIDIDLDGDGFAEPHVTVVYDEVRSDGSTEGAVQWTGEEIGDTWEEHRNAPINLMKFDGHAEQAGPGDGAAGDPVTGAGYQYGIIDVEDYGIIPGTDMISLRFKGKVV